MGGGYIAMGLYPLWFLISIRSLGQVGYRQHDLGAKGSPTSELLTQTIVPKAPDLSNANMNEDYKKTKPPMGKEINNTECENFFHDGLIPK
jgi:hypothetical protein